jgi:hypothetical protein
MKGALLDGFVRSDGKDGVGHRRCSRKGSDESTAPTCLGPPLNVTDPDGSLGIRPTLPSIAGGGP